jgi:alkaline phosphatase D
MTTRDPAVQLMQSLVASGRTSRRDILRAAFGLALAGLAPAGLAASSTARVRFSAWPFTLGVASGYPSADGVALWTRLAPAPLQPDGGMQGEQVDVQWQLAEDEAFARVVASGDVVAVPEKAHSVRVQVRGLVPGRWYHYRFMAGDAVSPSGRTRTADAPGAKVQRLRLGLGSCQHFEQGFFAAHRHLLGEDLDLMAFVGDYIYESSWGSDLVRRHATGTVHSLDDYRIRHAQYRLDPDLQRLHGAVPWVLTWDDHEVENDYAGAQGEYLDPAFLARRAAAYQAYFEHLPMPPAMPLAGPDARIFTRLDFGDLLRLHVLDDRQYRTPQACPSPARGGGSTEVVRSQCTALADPGRTLLGADQEHWFAEGVTGSPARWNTIVQQTAFVPYGREHGDDDRVVWTDGWDGYPAARQRLIDALGKGRTPNPVIIGGDVHATVVGDVHRDPSDLRTPVVASEFCGTSITSEGNAQAELDARRGVNPHVKYANSDRRGYLRLDFTRDGLAVALRALDDVKRADAGIETLASWTVEAGRPGVKPA